MFIDLEEAVASKQACVLVEWTREAKLTWQPLPLCLVGLSILGISPFTRWDELKRVSDVLITAFDFKVWGGRK